MLFVNDFRRTTSAPVTIASITNYPERQGRFGLVRYFLNIVRIFSDADFVFAHTEYTFDTARIGFEIFRFEGQQTVEHWDNIQRREGPNAVGHSMVDGPSEAEDLDSTEGNRQRLRDFVEDVLISGEFDQLKLYIDTSNYVEHSPKIATNKWSVIDPAAHTSKIQYTKLHRVLAQGNFVLTVSQGTVKGVQSAFFDLFRLSQGKLVEHWDTTEVIPARSEWKNQNGKF